MPVVCYCPSGAWRGASACLPACLPHPRMRIAHRTRTQLKPHQSRRATDCVSSRSFLNPGQECCCWVQAAPAGCAFDHALLHVMEYPARVLAPSNYCCFHRFRLCVCAMCSHARRVSLCQWLLCRPRGLSCLPSVAIESRTSILPSLPREKAEVAVETRQRHPFHAAFRNPR